MTLVGAGPDDSYTHPNLLRDTNEATTTTDASQDESNVESEVASRTSRSTRRSPRFADGRHAPSPVREVSQPDSEASLPEASIPDSEASDAAEENDNEEILKKMCFPACHFLRLLQGEGL